MNKMATVLINCLIWDKHASLLGLLSLFVCIAGGSLYKQAPLRKELDGLGEYSLAKSSPAPKESKPLESKTEP